MAPIQAFLVAKEPAHRLLVLDMYNRYKLHHSCRFLQLAAKYHQYK
jgi:hypothetical protein